MNFGPQSAEHPEAGSAIHHFALRVAIAHGNRLAGELLGSLCSQVWGCEVNVLNGDFEEISRATARMQPDLLVIGHQPPSVDALDLLSGLKSTIRVIVMVPQLNEYLVHRLLRLPFHAVVEETPGGIADLHTAITRVREGGRMLPPRFVQLATRLRSAPDAFPKLLSERHEAVLRCIAHAMNDEEIGRALDMSTATAKRHRADIARKLNRRSTPQQLISYALEKGFGTASLGPNPSPCPATLGVIP